MAISYRRSLFSDATLSVSRRICIPVAAFGCALGFRKLSEGSACSVSFSSCRFNLFQIKNDVL